MTSRSDQLPLFDDAEPPGPALPRAAASPADDPALRALGARLPAGVHFGTSSWSFPGWAGLVYATRRTTQELAREGLREYAAHPLLRTVGIDRGYYAPIPEDDLRRYASQIPPDFPCCLKAPATLTSVIVPESGRAGRPVRNPLFLDVDHFRADVLEPCARAFAAHTGGFILEFPAAPREMRLEPAAFESRLDAFLDALPRQFRYSVELRDRRLLTSGYAAVLRRHGVAHAYNYWSAMPPLAAQAQVVPPDAAPWTIVRLLLRPGTRYEEQREAFRPFNRIVDPNPEMRADVASLLTRALRARQPAFVLVNNKAEGSAPLTIRALVDAFFERWQAEDDEPPARPLGSSR